MAWLFNLCFPVLGFFFSGIMANAVVFSFTCFLIFFESYALSANIYFGLYFFITFMAAIANCVSNQKAESSNQTTNQHSKTNSQKYQIVKEIKKIS